ncbi:transcriptional regulator [Amycolatopsis antarctica]|uniref:Transcriptional regulator n=1 Tax=Amycolatopsis antarctica TaxID=1854586 RepID=A0A263CVA7_9PSEU|nr:methyltransferase domain-containing protein [Amycolatopsis antarctica]OZM70044.1 transcriptional regulator [Amycolatopsis antarctica]
MPGGRAADATTAFVGALIAGATDRTALSDELHFAARAAAERPHLDHGAANLLRALDIPAETRVLQLGAGTGALTRYLGETVDAVDAVEPDAELAAIARRRVEGLPGVRILPAPPEGGYDLVVAAESVPDVLTSARPHLRPGGTLCLPIVPAESTVDAFRLGRHSVRAAVRAAGFSSATVLGCLPDPRLARLVLTEEIARVHPRLTAALAGEPGTDYWRGFVVLAVHGETGSPLWPSDRLATYFNTAERAAPWATMAEVLREGEGARVLRRPLLPGPPTVEGISVRECSDAVVDAPTIPDVLLDEPWRSGELLGRWRDLLAEQAPEVGPALWDLLPHNVLVDGTVLRPIDLEWEHAGAGIPEVTQRGLLVLAHYLTEANWTGAAEGSTMRELAAWLGVVAGIGPSFVDDALEREVHFATVGSCGRSAGTGELSAAIRQVWRQRLDARVTHRPAEAEDASDPVGRAMSVLDRTIAPDDDRFYGSISGYFEATEAALRMILRAVGAAELDTPARVLDLGCGHGPVLRALRAAFPDAELLAMEEDPAALRFSTETFGASASSDPADIGLAWCGRALCYADATGWDRVAARLAGALREDGLAVLAVPGRRAAELLAQGRIGHDLPVPAVRRALADYRARGFGHAAHPRLANRSLTLTSADEAVRRLLRGGVLRLAGYEEAGLGEQYDVLVLRRDAAGRVHGDLAHDDRAPGSSSGDGRAGDGGVDGEA